MDPSPSALVAKTATLMSVEGGQDDATETSNIWLQVPLPQVEAGMVAEPQWLPEVESE